MAALFAGAFILKAEAQIITEKFRGFINSGQFSGLHLHYPDDVKRFYEIINFRICWITPSDSNAAIYFLRAAIEQSGPLGLRKTDYYPELFENASYPSINAIATDDSMATEIKYTDAAICFFHDIALGNETEPLSYNGLNYLPSCIDIPLMLSEYINDKKLAALAGDIEPKNDSYIMIRKELNFFQGVVSDKNFKDVFVTSSIADVSNTDLLERLNQLGLNDTGSIKMTKAQLKLQIKKAQELFNLLNDGELRSTTIYALNVPLKSRIAELANALNAERWLTCIRKKYAHVIITNIPSASLTMTENGKDILQSRIIVGKKLTPTPLFAAQVTQVILYPYWYVPHSISIKELLPAIKHNIHFLDENNFQVLDREGSLCDPSKINWQQLNKNNFPYTIRQSTGCDNSLGVIKLNLNSPYDVYMHDTPWKILFSFNNRYFSHGCIRVEKASELAHYVLKNNAIAIDTIVEKGCLQNQEPVIIPASEKIPVVIIYHTAWTDSAFNVHFYENVYNKKPANYVTGMMAPTLFSWLWQKIVIMLHSIFAPHSDIMLVEKKSDSKECS